MGVTTASIPSSIEFVSTGVGNPSWSLSLLLMFVSDIAVRCDKSKIERLFARYILSPLASNLYKYIEVINPLK
jgi:hypothetical protein